MAIIEYKKGDLLDAFQRNEFDAILQSCNCFHTQGRGIALAIKKRFPIALKVDKQTPYGEKNKLGTYSIADTMYGYIINAYTQFKFGRDRPHVDYKAIEDVMKTVNVDFNGKVIGIPKISSENAGGDWNLIEQIINKNTPDVQFIVYTLG